MKSIIRFLKAIKCKVFVCCGSKCSISNDEINISNINNNETYKSQSSLGEGQKIHSDI